MGYLERNCRWKHDHSNSRQPITIDWVIPYFEEFKKARLISLIHSQSNHIILDKKWSKPLAGFFALTMMMDMMMTMVVLVLEQ